ncbi:SOS response-associated peptidase [Cohnella sp. GCM10027633]|uniref:SOS response-associated peptidase n=1 Tax=unclassified Cohnella TaxID=2636738 RepID=UPI00362A3682
MCNRYSLTAELSDLTVEFGIDSVHIPYNRRYNISPTQLIPVIERTGEELILKQQRWGLMPYWGKSSVNTSLDSLGDKPYLGTMLKKKRCVLPCSGFYIWKQEGKIKRAWRVVHGDRRTFALPGLYDVWLDSEKNEYPMCTVITGDNAFGTDHALPLVLDRDGMDEWLDPKENRIDRLIGMLRGLPRADFHAYPVTPLVESMALETPDFIAELLPDYPLVRG